MGARTAILLILLAGCEGRIGLPAPQSPVPTPTPQPQLKQCATPGKGSRAKMRLLWRSAYLAELTHSLGTGAATAAASVGLSPATDKLFNYQSAGSLVTDATLDSLSSAADAVAVWALSTDANAIAVFGCNARTVTGTAAEDCFTQFLKTKGPRLLRRAVGDAEVADTLGFFKTEALAGESDGEQEGFRQGLASLLVHPDFLYLRDNPAGQSASLDAYSLASRVSFSLTGEGPDDLLFAAAQDGSLTQPDVLAAQVSRLLQSPAARTQSLQFYRQWLGYGTGSYAYSDAFLAGLSVTGLQDASTAELDGFVDALTWDQQAPPSALLTSRATAALPATLAAVYGATPGATSLPEDRAGLLTRVGMVASGSDDWHVVARGLAVAQKILCKPILPPTFSVAAAQMQAESLKVSNVDRLNTVTEAGVCTACHGTINPLGDARASYDAIGRSVSVEKHYAGGVFDFQVPVVATADLSVPLGRAATVDGSVALSNLLASSPEFESCFTTQYVRYVLGRSDDSDECLADDAAKTVASGGSILDGVRAVMTSSELTLWRGD